jgi:hypothetical protein
MATIAIIFFILSWIYCYVILWLDRNFKKFPILFCWYAVWGIIWVVMGLRWKGILSNEDVIALAITFGASFLGIYIANHIQWLRQNKKKFPRILLFDTIARNGKSKKTG